MKKTILAAMGLSLSTIANAAHYDMNRHVEFSYQVDCQNDAFSTYCSEPNAFSINTLSLDEQQKDYTHTQTPKYLSVADGHDWDYLMAQTYTILGLSVVTAASMTLLPESFTNWDEEDRTISDLGSKWWDNVSSGPVWDRDDHVLNYVMHPYFGGVYYTVARHSGFNEFESFLYSVTMSSFFWEYGVEAFAETPSWQDLFITPFFGAVVGEVMFTSERYILEEQDGEVLGSTALGDVSLFFLNPVGHIHHWVADSWGADAEMSFGTSPWFGNQEAASYALDAGAPYDHQFMSLTMSIKF